MVAERLPFSRNRIDADEVIHHEGYDLLRMTKEKIPCRDNTAVNPLMKTFGKDNLCFNMTGEIFGYQCKRGGNKRPRNHKIYKQRVSTLSEGMKKRLSMACGKNHSKMCLWMSRVRRLILQQGSNT